MLVLLMLKNLQPSLSTRRPRAQTVVTVPGLPSGWSTCISSPWKAGHEAGISGES